MGTDSPGCENWSVTECALFYLNDINLGLKVF